MTTAPICSTSTCIWSRKYRAHRHSPALDLAGRSVRRPELTIGVLDHVVPTLRSDARPIDPQIATQLQRLRDNGRRHGIEVFDLDSDHQGIVHVIGPELGLTRPGMSIVCGDSHTSTHGAFGCIAFGIGTSEVEHVLATQTIPQRRPRSISVEIDGELGVGVSAKDLALRVVRELGVGGGAGCAIEYSGSTIAGLSMESRMTLCNMSIEAGARFGIIAPDSTTIEYVRERAHDMSSSQWTEAIAEWSLLHSDDGAIFDRRVRIDAHSVEPTVTWGTTPAMSVAISGRVPRPC